MFAVCAWNAVTSSILFIFRNHVRPDVQCNSMDNYTYALPGENNDEQVIYSLRNHIVLPKTCFSGMIHGHEVEVVFASIINGDFFSNNSQHKERQH